MASSLAATPAPEASRPGRGGLLLLAVGVFAFCVLLRLPTYNRTDASGDLGKFLNESLRLYHGDLPYRDFWLLTPPGDEVVAALIYRATGISVNAVLLFGVVVGGLGGALGLLAAAAVVRRRWLAVLVALGLFFIGATVNYLVLLFAAALAFFRYLRGGSRRALAGAGVLVGVALWFEFFLVGAALAAMAAVVLCFPSPGGLKGGRERLRNLAALLLPSLSVAFLLYLPFHAVWPQMLRQFFVESPRHGTSMPLPWFYDSFASWRLLAAGLRAGHAPGQIARMAYDFGWGLTDVAQYLLPLFMAGLGAWFLLGRRLRAVERPAVVFLLLWALLSFPKALARSDLGHLWMCAPPLLLALGIFLEAEGRGRRRVGPVLVVALLTGLLLPMSLIRATRDFRAPGYAVTAPQGRLVLPDAQEATDINDTLQFIQTHSGPGDYIFVPPWFMPPFYTLADRRNPTYYDSFIDPVALPSREKQEAICRDLLAKPTRIVVTYPDWGLDNRPRLQWLVACPLVEECIVEHFQRVATYGRYWVYVPKSAG